MTTFIKTTQFKMSVFVGIYILVSIPISLYLNSFLHIFLGWNLILALIPLYASYLFLKLSIQQGQKTKHHIILIVLFIVWLFFLPNTFYVITDLIHLGNREFYITNGFYEPWVYVENIKNYLALIHIFIGVVISLTAGVFSLSDMFEYVQRKYQGITANIFVIVVLFLSSIAIYIGRFLRFNSWDILHPFKLINTLFNSLDLFFVQFVLLFWITQGIIYYFIRFLIHNEKGECHE